MLQGHRSRREDVGLMSHFLRLSIMFVCGVLCATPQVESSESLADDSTPMRLKLVELVKRYDNLARHNRMAMGLADFVNTPDVSNQPSITLTVRKALFDDAQSSELLSRNSFAYARVSSDAMSMSHVQILIAAYVQKCCIAEAIDEDLREIKEGHLFPQPSKYALYDSTLFQDKTKADLEVQQKILIDLSQKILFARKRLGEMRIAYARCVAGTKGYKEKYRGELKSLLDTHFDEKLLELHQGLLIKPIWNSLKEDFYVLQSPEPRSLLRQAIKAYDKNPENVENVWTALALVQQPDLLEDYYLRCQQKLVIFEAILAHRLTKAYDEKFKSLALYGLIDKALGGKQGPLMSSDHVLPLMEGYFWADYERSANSSWRAVVGSRRLPAQQATLPLVMRCDTAMKGMGYTPAQELYPLFMLWEKHETLLSKIWQARFFAETNRVLASKWSEMMKDQGYAAQVKSEISKLKTYGVGLHERLRDNVQQRKKQVFLVCFQLISPALKTELYKTLLGLIAPQVLMDNRDLIDINHLAALIFKGYKIHFALPQFLVTDDAMTDHNSEDKRQKWAKRLAAFTVFEDYLKNKYPEQYQITQRGTASKMAQDSSRKKQKKNITSSTKASPTSRSEANTHGVSLCTQSQDVDLSWLDQQPTTNSFKKVVKPVKPVLKNQGKTASKGKSSAPMPQENAVLPQGKVPDLTLKFAGKVIPVSLLHPQSVAEFEAAEAAEKAQAQEHAKREAERLAQQTLRQEQTALEETSVKEASKEQKQIAKVMSILDQNETDSLPIKRGNTASEPAVVQTLQARPEGFQVSPESQIEVSNTDHPVRSESSATNDTETEALQTTLEPVKAENLEATGSTSSTAVSFASSHETLLHDLAAAHRREQVILAELHQYKKQCSDLLTYGAHREFCLQAEIQHNQYLRERNAGLFDLLLNLTGRSSQEIEDLLKRQQQSTVVQSPQ